MFLIKQGDWSNRWIKIVNKLENWETKRNNSSNKKKINERLFRWTQDAVHKCKYYKNANIHNFPEVTVVVLNLPVLSLFLFCLKYASPYLFLYFHLDSNAVRLRGGVKWATFNKGRGWFETVGGKFQISAGKKKYKNLGGKFKFF